MSNPIYYEDFNIGDKFTSPGRTLSDGAIDTLMALGGFIFPFFWDEEYAKTTVFKGRVAPGRLTLFMMGGLVEQAGVFSSEGVVALVGMDKVRVRSPLRGGDTIRVEMEIIGKKETSKENQGLLVHTEVCKNQNGEIVAEAEFTHIMRRRPK